MKNLLLKSILFLSIIFIAQAAIADEITPSEAWKKAQPYIKVKSSMARAMRGVSKTATTTESQPLYIFSRGEGEGFVVVSGDNCLPDIIGYTENGDYDEENLPPALKAIIEHYAEAVQDAQARGVNRPYSSVTASTYDKDIEPLLTCHWGQGSPWNDLCPQRSDGGGRAVTGCVATAASQIAYYWRNEGLNAVSQYDTPTYGYGDAPVTTVIVKKGTPFEWEKMADRSTTSAGNATMARLCVLMGTSAWLTYGASTGGYIYNMQDVFQNQIGMTRGSYVEKDNYSQSAWENMVISDLVQGRPILYSSYNIKKENWDGHAYVVDGYKTNGNLFHINLGWGDGYDGYWTMAETDKRDAMAGRPDHQQMVYQLYSQNIDRTFEITSVNETMYRNIKNPIKLSVQNNSSMAIDGLYLFCSTASEFPSTMELSDAFASFDVKLEKGSSVEYSADLVTSKMSAYLYVTDRNMSVLYKTPEPVKLKYSKVNVTMQYIAVDNSGSTERTFMYGGEEVTRKVYNVPSGSTLQMSAVVSNDNDGSTVCMPALTALISTIDEQTGACTTVATQVNRDSLFRVGDTKALQYEIDNLSVGILYKASINNQVKNYMSDTSFTLQYNEENADSIVFFTLTGKDFDIKRDGSHVSVTGTSYEMAPLTEILADATVTSYDFRNYSGRMPIGFKTENPNAIMYFAADRNVKGVNIVVNGECEEVELYSGSDYSPIETFTAKKATCHINSTPCTASVYYWNPLVLPFTMSTPYGVLARQFNSATETEIHNATIEAGKQYLFHVVYGLDELSAENVQVYALKDMTPNTANPNYIGTFSNITADGSQCVSTGKKLERAAVGTVIPSFSCYSTQEMRLITTLTPVSGLEAALHKLTSQCAAALTALEEYRGQRTGEQIATFEAAILEAEKAITFLSSVPTEVDAARTTLEAATDDYVNNVTDIKGVNAKPQVERKGKIYDLMGRRLSDIPERGIYIIDGKVYCK